MNHPLIKALLVAVLCPSLAAAPQDGLAHLGAGLKLYDLERYSEAAKEFDLALRVDPRLADARFHLAVSYFSLHRYPEAREQFRALAPSGYRKDWVTYYLARLDLTEMKLDSAIAGFRSLLKRSDPLKDELFYLGQAYMKKGEPEKAVPLLERAAAWNPRDFRVRDVLGRADVKLGHPRQAEREFEESGRLHEYYLAGKKDLIACRQELLAGQAERAWAACGAALNADDIDKLVGVGMIFGEFGYYDRALQLFQKAVELDPDSPEINYDLGFTYFKIKDYPKARRYLDAATRLRPDSFEALALYGTVLYVLRDDAPALDMLRRAHRFRPDDPSVRKLLAQLESQHRAH